jgi:hypothetical protein
MRVTSVADLNGDGAPDFGILVVVPHNRDPEDVEDAFVYLSRLDQRSYCFAAGLQNLVRDLRTGRIPQALDEVVADKVRRLGPSILQCRLP